jgi:hypothetical protein
MFHTHAAASFMSAVTPDVETSQVTIVIVSGVDLRQQGSFQSGLILLASAGGRVSRFGRTIATVFRHVYQRPGAVISARDDAGFP